MSNESNNNKDVLSNLILTLDKSLSDEERDQIIITIARIGEVAIPELLQYAKTLYRKPSWRMDIIKIFRLMGYPTNKYAIPWIVSLASNINSPGWDIALETLKEIGSPAIPKIREAIKYYSDDYVESIGEIQGLCILLKQMGSPIIDPLLPELITLLEAGTDEAGTDEYALLAIRKIGSPKADTAIPIIGRIIASQREPFYRKSSIEALEDFDPSAIRPLLPILRNCLNDEDKSISDAAQKIIPSIDNLS
jgi:hypothetical protein